MKTWQKTSLTLLGLGVLLAVFSLYGRPDFLVMLADQIWACF